MEKFAFTLLQLTVVSKLSTRDLVPNKLDPLLFLKSKTTSQTAEQEHLQIFFCEYTKNLRKMPISSLFPRIYTLWIWMVEPNGN